MASITKEASAKIALSVEPDTSELNLAALSGLIRFFSTNLASSPRI